MIPNFNNNGPCFELFSSASDIIKYWKQKGKIMKEFETHTKSYVYSLQFGGVSMLSIPINEKHSLQINNACLLFQFILFCIVYCAALPYDIYFNLSGITQFILNLSTDIMRNNC